MRAKPLKPLVQGVHIINRVNYNFCITINHEREKLKRFTKTLMRNAIRSRASLFSSSKVNPVCLPPVSGKLNFVVQFKKFI